MHHRVVAAVLGGVGQADGVRQLGGDRDRDGRSRCSGPGCAALQVAGEDSRIFSIGQPRQSMAAVSRKDGTIQSVRPQGRDAADLGGLLALDRREGADAPLALQPQHALVEAAAEEHRAMEALELVGGDRGLEGGVQVAVAVQDGQVLDGELRLDQGPRHGGRLVSLAFYPGPL